MQPPVAAVLAARHSPLSSAMTNLRQQPAGKPVRGEDGVASGAELDVLIEFTDKAGAKKRLGMESVLADRKTGKVVVDTIMSKEPLETFKSQIRRLAR